MNVLNIHVKIQSIHTSSFDVDMIHTHLHRRILKVFTIVNKCGPLVCRILWSEQPIFITNIEDIQAYESKCRRKKNVKKNVNTYTSVKARCFHFFRQGSFFIHLFLFLNTYDIHIFFFCT